MRITVLGCAGSVPGPDRATSGYLVEAEGFRMAVDLGNGTLANLQSHCDSFDLAALLLSHLHLDHCGDFTALATIRREHPDPPYDPRRHKLPVYAPSNAPTRLAGAYAPNEEARQNNDFTDIFQFLSLTSGTLHIGPFDVRVLPMRHICEAYGFRITHRGRSFVYTGDTVRCPELVELATGADILMADASWRRRGDRPDTLHMSGREAAQAAEAAGVTRLLLTHVLPWSDRDGLLADAVETFSGPVELVEQGMTYTV